jgi:hypothetical protein
MPDPTFSRPIPAIGALTSLQKSNDPRDVDAPQPGGGGLASNPQWQALNTPGPFQPPAGVMQDLPTQVRAPDHVGEWMWTLRCLPQSRDELRARAAELNKDN